MFRVRDLVTATVTNMSLLVRRREVSPVELTQVTLERVEALNPKLECFVTITPEHAMRRAQEAEKEISSGRYRGPMHGIPYTLKDIIATKGIRTTFGDPRGKDYKPKESATVHRLLDEAGGILIGKVVSEIGRDSSGPVGCRNPWDITKSPGSSSSGSASAVAASLGLASVGSDTWGSVRHPASNSGLVGLKPTFGRISRFGVFATSWSTDQAGPLTKTVEDNAIMLEILGVHDPKDPVSINEPAYDYRTGLNDSIKGVRVGVPVDDWIWKQWVQEEEEDLVRKAIAVLEELGAGVCEIALPRAGEPRVSVGASLEAHVYTFDHFSKEDIDDWPEVQQRIYPGMKQSFADYLHFQQKRAFIRQELMAVLKQVDLVAFPTGNSLGDDWNAEKAIIRGKEVTARSRATNLNNLASLIGAPAISVPCGFAMGNRLPVGLQLIGRDLAEALLFRVAYAYEQATPWHSRYPEL